MTKVFEPKNVCDMTPQEYATHRKKVLHELRSPAAKTKHQPPITRNSKDMTEFEWKAERKKLFF